MFSWQDTSIAGPLAERIAARLEAHRSEGKYLRAVSRIDVGQLPPQPAAVLLASPVRLFVSCFTDGAGGATEYMSTTSYDIGCEIDVVGKVMAPSSLEGYAEMAMVIDDLMDLIAKVEQQNKWGDTPPSPYGRSSQFVSQSKVVGGRTESGGLGTVDGTFFHYRKLMWTVTVNTPWSA